jgi:enoyl-CoA hydratase/carnithine racemase
MDETTRALGKLFDRISALPQVTLAEISGVAVGGGLELALACDLRVAAHTAKLGLPELKLGLLPAAGGTQRLTALCGRATALRLILFSEQLSGVAAAAAGLVQWTVPDAEVGEFARRRAAELAAQPRAALELAKACIRTASDVSGAGLELEKAGAARLFAQEGTRVLVQRFLERAAR